MYKSIWHRFDVPLLLVTLVLVVIGGVMIYSSYEANLQIQHESLLENLVFRQGLFAGIGLVAYFFAAAVDYHWLLSLRRGLYIVALLVLGITLVMGHTSFGAQSWLLVQQFTLQPSELAKVLVVLVLASVLGVDEQQLESPLPLLISVAVVVLPVVLIYYQPDFGTALIVVAIWVGMVFLAGVRWRHLLGLGILGAIATPVIWFRLQGYMRERILSFFMPETSSSGASYNITQALISIGSGGWWGKGLLHGTQSQLYFLRVRHTDFIFSVLAEELGFVGAMLLLILFAFLLLRLVRIALAARDAPGRLIVGGVATMIFIQAFINLGMNANILPVTGLPLPLVSYGGNSLLTTLFGLGLAQSVAMRSKPLESTLL